jgi:hypothetical protein
MGLHQNAAMLQTLDVFFCTCKAATSQPGAGAA